MNSAPSDTMSEGSTSPSRTGASQIPSRPPRSSPVVANAPVTKPWGQTVAYVRDGDGVLVELCSAFGG